MMRLDSGGWVRLKDKGGMSECGPPHQQPAAKRSRRWTAELFAMHS